MINNSIYIQSQQEVFDVVIVGSGAGGGMAAHTLTKAGAKVCVLEAGQPFDPADPKNITQLKWPYESPRRGTGTTRAFGDFDAAYGGWEIDGEPYTRKNGTKFDWFRARMVGGRTNHWGRISLRFGPDDFKRKSIDGLGDDWPIGYDDMKPFYDKIDKMLGVFGTNEGLRNDPDGFFLPPPKPRLHELMIKKANKALGIPTYPSRLSILTKSINSERGACFYCAQCSRGCSAYADFSSSSVLVKPAMATGNLTLLPFAMAREVMTDAATGLATGVSYVHTGTLQEYSVRGKIVMLAASAGETARLLLNSKSSRFPDGIANSSGVVGKYINDSTGASRSAIIPKLFDRKVYNEDGVGGLHVYTPWWGDNTKLDFPRGYHIEYGGGMGMPNYGFGWGIEGLNGKEKYTRDGLRKAAGGYGATLKEDYRRYYGSYVGFAGRGEPVPREDNYCEIDPNVVDKYGIPVVRFNYKWSDYEIKQAKHMQDTFEQIIQEMGGEALGKKPGADTNYGLADPGRIIHEVGTARMGNNSSTSVVNSNCQAHDVKNLFLADSSPFVSQGDKNATWTILALSLRTSEYIIDQRKKPIYKMKRRDYLKNIGLSSLGLAVLNPDARAMEQLENANGVPKAAALKIPGGRTKDEAERDAKLMAEVFLNKHELDTITILSDIIIPADKKSGSASQSGVTGFIEFIVKDKPELKTPVRGGLRWLDSESNRRFSKLFTQITPAQRINIVDDIAYPEKAKKQFSQGVNFFTLMRNLTATGFYTSRIGIDDLGYKGNTPNEWKGVPADVLKQYGLSYDD